MEEQERLSVKTAFYLLKHFEKIDSEIEKIFHEAGFEKNDIEIQLKTIGSKFDHRFCRNPFEILSTLKKGKMLEEIHQSNHRIARTYEFSEIVGTDQVLGSNVIDSKKVVPLLRNDQIIQVIYQEKLPSTRHLVIVESANKEIITAFPGKYAPPFPNNKLNPSENKLAETFWENHVFVIQQPISVE
jgi:hypothetical protein